MKFNAKNRGRKIQFGDMTGRIDRYNRLTGGPTDITNEIRQETFDGMPPQNRMRRLRGIDNTPSAVPPPKPISTDINIKDQIAAQLEGEAQMQAHMEMLNRIIEQQMMDEDRRRQEEFERSNI